MTGVPGCPTFHTPIPRRVMARIGEMQILMGKKNKAEVLFFMVEALAKELDIPRLGVGVMKGFVPYPEDDPRHARFIEQQRKIAAGEKALNPATMY